MATKIPRSMLDQIKDARRAATLEQASFGWRTDLVQLNSQPAENVTDFIRRKTELYRETWIIPQLDAVIRWAEGED